MESFLGKHTTKVQQLADTLEQHIVAGIYEGGNGLPSINQLSRMHNVSRDTVFMAFSLLREKGFIDSTPGKGYYITNQRKKVLLLLDEYSLFKTTFYNRFIQGLPSNYQVDLWFHQYNQQLFDAILREAAGKYNHYVVMNINNEEPSPLLNKLPSSRLLLLDFGNFDKQDLSFICQDFDAGIYSALMQLKERFKRYNRNIFFFPKGIQHPKVSRDSFLRFCRENGLSGTIVEDERALEVTQGTTYFVIRQIDVVNIIKQSRARSLQCGKDFGLVAYNDTPAYEVIDNGITTLTINWEKMGEMASRSIVNGEHVQEYLPTEVHLRHSL